MSIASDGIKAVDAETSVFPENLFDEATEEPSDRRWWVLYTKARHEKAVARALFGHRIPFFLPLIKKTNVYRRNRVTSHIPLFPGYVFMYGTELERVDSLTTNHVSRILTPSDEERMCEDLCRVRKLITSNAPLSAEARLIPGNRVRVRYGALGGLEGTVLVRRGKTRLVVIVDFLQQGASVEIEDFMLESLD